MSDYPIREKAARRPKPNNPFTRACQSCGADFLALAVGITGERGIWTEGGRWWCSRECAPTTDASRYTREGGRDVSVKQIAKFGVRHPRHDEATLDDLCPNSGASTGVCGCVSCSETTASGRRILQDLIAELRAQHYADQCECGCEQWYECEPCSHISLCPTQEAAVRAEARLREVTGDE